MTEMLANLLTPIMEELGRITVVAIKRQFNYLCCFNSNIRSLREEAKNLEDAIAGLQMQVDTAKNTGEEILPEVETWLITAANQTNITEIENEIPKARWGFLNIKSRYSKSRKAKKTTEAMRKLHDSCNFSLISQPPPPASMVSLPLGTMTTYEFQSRKKMEEDIMEVLRGKTVNILGICGMGGVGKTVMAEKIANRVKAEHLFDEVVMTAVSQAVDMMKIQQKIGELLGINEWRAEELEGRAHQLRSRLMGNRRILVVLDDVWEMLKLKELGIPCQKGLRERCTVLLTSRNKDVLDQMDAQYICAVQILSEQEAWHLFREKVGTCVDDFDLLSIAKQVMQECKGLPLALTTVGMTLKNENDKGIWEDALQQLKSSNPVDMHYVVPNLYHHIKLSYDFLDNQHARSLFLLCSLFPEDYDIHLDYLAIFCIGLCMFVGINNVEGARNRVRILLKILKGRSLLLDGRNENHVKMHDVVRDVANFIASRENVINLSFSLIDHSRERSIDCSWISVVGKEKKELPVELCFPRLSLLMMMENSYENFGDDNFFQGMEGLHVLSLHRIELGALPQTIELLQNLRTLCLEKCSSLVSISTIGKLLNLEILICRFCDKITKLPVEIGSLNRLKLLEVSDCKKVKRIAPGLISNLVQLEELTIVRSFKSWERKGNEEQKKNATLGELELLKNLTNLKIEIDDPTLIAEEICLSPKIVKYHIKTIKKHIRPGIRLFEMHENISHEKGMHLVFNKDEITIGGWIQTFLRSTEYLCAEGDASSNLDLAQVPNIRSLTYKRCSTMNKLVNRAKSMNSSFGVFPLLESLHLIDLENFEEICAGPIPKEFNSFGKLKELELHSLPALQHLWKFPQQNVSLCNLSSIVISICNKLHKPFPLSIAKDGLLLLQKLDISRCQMMEAVFSNDENDNDGDRYHIIFPKLKYLNLLMLPRLTTFFQGISESIEFPVLDQIHITKCLKLKTWDNLNLEGGHGDDSFHLFCNQKVVFGSLNNIHISEYDNISIWCHQIPLAFFTQLEDLKITYCSNIKSLFSSSIAENLVNLKRLEVTGCKQMVNVIEDKEMLCEKSSHNLLFPSLQKLELSGLARLQNFWKLSRCDLQLPSLTSVKVSDCPSLEFLTSSGSVSTPNLKFIEIDSKKIDVGDDVDLNGVLQLHFQEKGQHDSSRAV